MRKIFYLMAMAIAAVTFTACSDDKTDDANLVIGEDGAKEVTINRLGGVIDVPITCNGTWTASLPEDCDWAGVSDANGRGNKQLEINVDYLNPSVVDADRSAILTVTAGDKKQTIKIRQYVGLEDGENAAYLDATGFNDLYTTRGLGLGFNIMPTENNIVVTKNQIISKQTLDKLAKEDDEFKDIITETTDPSEIGKAGPTEVGHFDSQHLDVNATIQVTYGLFKLGINGHYKMGQTNDKQNYQFYAGYTVPRVKAILNTATLEEIADDKTYLDAGFTRGFKGTRKKIIAQFETDAKTANYASDRLKLAAGDAATWAKYADLESELRALDTKFGPLYVASATIGGDLTMEITCDTTAVTDSIIAGGEVTASFTTGLLTLSGDVKVNYSKIATDVLKKGVYAFTVRGGSTAAQKGLNDALGMDKAKINTANIQAKISEWVNSIPNDLTGEEAYRNLSAYEQGLAPTWGLFPGKYQSVIRGFFLYLYKDKNTLVDLNNF